MTPRGRASGMRPLVLATTFLLAVTTLGLAGCTASVSTTSTSTKEWTTHSNTTFGPQERRVVLGQASVPVAPGADAAIAVKVPPTGAKAVQWTVAIRGALASGQPVVVGPGCVVTDGSPPTVGIGGYTVKGTCDDLAPDVASLTLSSGGASAGLADVEVTGAV